MTEETSALRDDLDAILAPVREQVEEIDRQLAHKQTELQELKEARRQRVAVLRAADRSPVKPGPKKGSGASVPSPQRIEQVFRYLQENFRDEEFSVPILIKREDFRARVPLSQSPLNKILRQLSERGLIRLDHIGAGPGEGGPGRNQERFFRLVSGG